MILLSPFNRKLRSYCGKLGNQNRFSTDILFESEGSLEAIFFWSVSTQKKVVILFPIFDKNKKPDKKYLSGLIDILDMLLLLQSIYSFSQEKE